MTVFSVLRGGVPGTARVLSVTRTDQVSRSPEAGWHAPWVHRLELLVSIPGRAPYVATCRLYAPDIHEGATVLVAVSPLWSHRVTIDFSAGPRVHVPVNGTFTGVGGTAQEHRIDVAAPTARIVLG
jgi:hypothetical protein